MLLSTMRLDEEQTAAAESSAGGIHAERERRVDPPTSSPIPTLDHLLVEAAIQCPEADALIGEFGSLSYADLLIRAQNIAVTLKRRGIGPGHFVGVAMEQTPVVITAIVGIILTGAAYVPLGDQLRTAGMRRVRANRVDLVLRDGVLENETGRGPREQWQGIATVLDASRIEQETMPSSDDIKLLNLGSERPAAILLDAAEAGDSAGVLISHRSIARLTNATAIMEISARETFLLPHATHARAGLFELWGSLLHGATLALQPREPMGPAAFAEWVRRHSVTVLCLSVAKVHQYVDHAPALFSKLRHLIIESDGVSGSVSPQRIERLQREYPGLRIVNTYGTSRTAGYATAFKVPRRYQVQATLPIGQPLEGSQAFLLDHSGEPVRAGEIGELAFAGDCVGWSAQDSSESHQYRTGERARLRADGLLELHGHAEPKLSATHARNSEAAEVEATIPGQQNVGQPSVMNDTDRDGWQHLVAFVAAGNEEEQRLVRELDQMEGEQQNAMPPAAMPSAIRYVEDLPHDVYGDVDRHALQQRWKKENERSHATERVQQDTLEQIRGLWLRLLRRSSVGYEEDFFEAGGTRVQMIRMHAELNRRFPGAITMAQLSVLRTIHKIYEHLVTHTSSGRPGIAQRGA